MKLTLEILGRRFTLDLGAEKATDAVGTCMPESRVWSGRNA